jgi:hypothetical protein
VIDNQGYIVEDEQKHLKFLQKELKKTAPKLKSFTPAGLQRPKFIPPVSAMGSITPTPPTPESDSSYEDVTSSEQDDVI